MDLLEYQVKQLFAQFTIPVLPSQKITNPQQIKDLNIPYPVVLKSQIHKDGKVESGCVRLVENRIDAIAVARMIFNLPIGASYPQVILAEALYQTQEKLLLAVILDYQLQRPILLGSTQGGKHCDVIAPNLHRVIIEEEFSPFYARNLAVKMGLPKYLIKPVSDIVEKMYHLFIEKDLDSIEINPLAIHNGEVMALNGKITVNDNALNRHPEIKVLGGLEVDRPQWLTQVNTQGTVGVICNDKGLALCTWDLLCQAQGNPAACLMINTEKRGYLKSVSELEQQLYQAWEELAALPQLKVILINLLTNPGEEMAVAEAIVNYFNTETPSDLSLQHKIIQSSISSSNQSDVLANPQLVIRLLGWESQLFKQCLATNPVYYQDSLDEAVNQAIFLAQPSVN